MVLNGPHDNLLCSYTPYTFAQKSSKNKGMRFDFFRKKHITEALFLQIRVEKNILVLSVLTIFSMFFTIICNAMPCALSNNHYGSTCF